MEYSNNPRSPTGRGPHRRKDLTQRILNAAVELMVEEGYGRCSVDAISAKSGVAKPTIYRRYANRHEIALAALEQRLEVRPVPNYGNLETDLRAMIAEMLRGQIEGGGIRLLATVVVEEKRHPELLALVRQRWIWPRQKLIKTVLERAKRRGELRSGIDLDVVTTVVWGTVVGEYLTGVGRRGRFVEGVMKILSYALVDPHRKPAERANLADRQNERS